jgi:predicted nuclease with TOPRIM domain
MNEEKGEIMRSLGKIEGKVDGINQRLDVSNGRTAKLEAKVDVLEAFVNNLKGRMFMWSAFAGLLSVLGMWALQHFFK